MRAQLQQEKGFHAMHIRAGLEKFPRSVQLVMVVFVAGLSALFAVPAKAAPFTTNFVALITDLQDRAAALSNSTDKVEEKGIQNDREDPQFACQDLHFAGDRHQDPWNR